VANSHKRDTNARPKPKAVKVAAPLALVATLSAVSLGVLAGDPVVGTVTATQASTDVIVDRDDAPVSRSTSRSSASTSALDASLKSLKSPNLLSKAQTAKAIKNAKTQLWTTDQLNIWTEPGDKAEKLGELEAGKKVLVTGREMWGRDEIVLGGKSRWVTSGYLSDEKPPTLGGPCTNGTSVSGSASVVAVHRAVCAAFPQITSFGTLRGGGGDHGSGRAIDIMVSGALGWQVAELVRANYAALGVSYVIYSQRIWSVERSGEGWRGMSSRGSATANHYDHVHVSVF
jgi:hypothetical protein